MGDQTGVKCPHCGYEFNYSELPWEDTLSVDFCSDCDAPIHLIAVTTVNHKISKTEDEIDFVDPNYRK